MSIVVTAYRTVTCNGPECQKSVTFEQNEKAQAETFAKEENAWLKSFRIVKTPDGRELGYCGDVCEANAIKTGAHNLPEPKRIIAGVANAAQVEQAAAAAKAAEAANTALRTGQPVTLS